MGTLVLKSFNAEYFPCFAIKQSLHLNYIWKQEILLKKRFISLQPLKMRNKPPAVVLYHLLKI